MQANFRNPAQPNAQSSPTSNHSFHVYSAMQSNAMQARLRRLPAQRNALQCGDVASRCCAACIAMPCYPSKAELSCAVTCVAVPRDTMSSVAAPYRATLSGSNLEDGERRMRRRKRACIREGAEEGGRRRRAPQREEWQGDARLRRGRRDKEGR